MLKPITMKSLRILFLIILTLNTVVGKLSAQTEDYVITQKGDTIKCVITKSVWSANYTYKSPEMAKPQKIYVEDIKEFYNSETNTLVRAVRKSEKGNLFFLALIEGGKIDLYEEVVNQQYSNGFTGVTSYNNYKKWYIAKGANVVQMLKTSDVSLGAVFVKSKKQRESSLAEMIADNKEIYDKYITDNDFSFKEIRHIIHLYNTTTTSNPGKQKDPER